MTMKLQSALLAAAAAAALSISAPASAAGTGVYIQGDIGLGRLNADDSNKLNFNNAGRRLKDSYKESGFMPRISAGYELGNGVRVAVDFTHYKDVKENGTVAGIPLGASIKANSFGLSGIYDFDLGNEWTPYLGARLGMNKLKYTATAAGISFSESKTKAGLGIMAGVGYKLSDELTLDAGYRYNRLESDLRAHEVTVGVRYYF